jgi:hypothetical protein
MKSAQKASPQWHEPQGRGPPLAPRRAADPTQSLQADLLEPHGRFQVFDALQAAWMRGITGRGVSRHDRARW